MLEHGQNPVSESRPRKAGRYSRVLTGDCLVSYEEALASPEEGFENEIALLKAMLESMVLGGLATAHRLILQTLNCLEKLGKAQRRYFHKDDAKPNMEDILANAFARAATEYGVPLETQMLDPLRKQAGAS